MEHLFVMIKPASSLCNLSCEYCFYKNIADIRDIPSFGIMSEETAENVIGKAIDFSTRVVTFAFQGGEPTLAGIKFFRFFTNKVKELNVKRLDINYVIQTNGMTVDEEFAQFLKENKFLVGLSIDGYKEIHDFLRVDRQGKGTYNRLMKTARLFNKYNVDYNILTVITKFTAKHIEKIYSSFKNSGFRYLQFIPCLDPLDAEPFKRQYSLTPEFYEKFLITLFKLWYDDFMSGNYISIRFFDNLVHIMQGGKGELCGTNGACMGQFVVEADGGVYPCDFYCVDNWKTGNLNEHTFSEIANSETMKKFIATSVHNDEKCKNCRVHYLCKGGCRRDRDLKSDGVALENVFCSALHNFYVFAEPLLKDIVDRLAYTHAE